MERLDKDLEVVQALELRLGITSRWTKESPDFNETARLLSMRQYQCALDNLEGLVVARIFELSKMNRSQSGKFIHTHY